MIAKRRAWCALVVALGASLVAGSCASAQDGAGTAPPSSVATSSRTTPASAPPTTATTPTTSISATGAATAVDATTAAGSASAATATSAAAVAARRDRWTVLPQPPVRTDSEVLAGEVVVVAGRTWERLGIEPRPHRLFSHGLSSEGAWAELPAPPMPSPDVSLVVGLPGIALASVSSSAGTGEGQSVAPEPRPLWRLDVGSGAWTSTSVPPERIVPWDGDGAVYDPVRASWMAMADGPLAAVRSPLAAGLYGDVLLFGGTPGNPAGAARLTMPPGPQAQAAAYDLRTSTWRILADVPVAPVGPAGSAERPVAQRLGRRPAARAGDAVVVMGGSIGPQPAEAAPGQLPPFVYRWT